MGKSHFGHCDEITKYMADHSVRLTAAQGFLIEATRNERDNRMMMSSDEAQLLANLSILIGARKTLDIGVYTGYSSLSIAQVLPDGGRVVALDLTDEYLDKYCRPAWRMAGVEHKIDFRKGPALDSLEKLIADGESGTYDMACIDADKSNYLNYYEKCLKLVRTNGIIAFDNVLWGGSVAYPSDKSETTCIMRKLNDTLAADSRIRLSMIRIGDGLTVAIKL